ncbi:hypothetical protein AAJP47_12690 [Psychrobacter sp. B38]|uniref:hypothetical protein n=1 Tax=Psychrobacter sp. B38 TaxID=3143538 RepID=UPI0032109154
MLIDSQQNPSTQSGFATILMVLLIGLAVTASAVGTAYYINTSQKGLVSSHALTNVESGAWAGVETFRKYLNNLNPQDIQDLNGQSLILKISDDREMKVNNISIEKIGTDNQKYYVTTNIQNISEKAKAASTLKIVYEISFDTDSSTATPGSEKVVVFPNAMNFYGDLIADGGIEFSDSVKNAVVSVDGKFSTSSGLKGVRELKTTDDVSISGGGAEGLENIYSNGDVELTASGSYSLVSAKGKVKTTGGVSIKDIYADGNVDIKSGGIFNSIDTKKSIKVEAGPTITKAVAEKKIDVKNGTIHHAFANSDIDYDLWNTIKTAESGGTFKCVSEYWSNYEKISAVDFKSCPSNKGNLVTLPKGAKVASPTGALVEVTIDKKPMVNALAYEESANYVFSVDNRDRIKVYVRQVKGIAEDSYYLGKTKVNYSQSWGYLCKTVDNEGYCTSKVVGNFAKNYSWINQIITYKNNEWLLRDTQNSELSIASGVLFFKGKVNLSMGKYANTIIATDDIDYGGSITLKAPNHAGAQQTCGSQYFPMPTNLCTPDRKLSLPTIGNIALLSGSCKNATSMDKCSKNYDGGDIRLGAQATVEGSIIAGNKLESSGRTVIKGPILAAAMSKSHGGNDSKLGGSTSIDFNGVDDDSTVITLPSGEDEEDSSASTTQRVKVKWAKYV